VVITVPSFAKINLDLRVLNKRPDGYHELRTIFQTISLKDSLDLDFQTSRRTAIELASSLDIPDNLVLRAARLVFDHLKITGRLSMRLRKAIPMGAGLGGGSSNAASILLALPALVKKEIAYPELLRLAEFLGSDVPVFLHGGTVLGIGRGTELYPLPDQPSRPALIVSTGVHVSTPDAYRNLNRTLTSDTPSPMLGEFQTIIWNLDKSSLDALPLVNDFEQAVFASHPQLGRSLTKLRRAGARVARMTGSGSALFGVFLSASAAKAAAAKFVSDSTFAVNFVSRRQYKAAWRRALASLAAGGVRSNN
jgi:4-diphosphocytidyl-2-C-methyl-D-erythritol kinase